MDERLKVLVDILGREAFALGRTLHLEKSVLAYLLAARYPAGISELQSVVRIFCSVVLRSALSDRDTHLAIECCHLPQ